MDYRLLRGAASVSVFIAVSVFSQQEPDTTTLPVHAADIVSMQGVDTAALPLQAADTVPVDVVDTVSVQAADTVTLPAQVTDTTVLPVHTADDSVAPAEDLAQDVVTEKDSVVIEGLVVDSVTGLFPKLDRIEVYADSLAVPIDTLGNFSVSLRRAAGYHLTIFSGGRLLFSERLADDPEKPNMFVTCRIARRKAVGPPLPVSPPQPIDGVPWTISGCIVDSRLDLAILSARARLTFDDSLVTLAPKGSFVVTARQPGTHTFHLRVPGYHEVYETVLLTENEKQPFVTIATTGEDHALKRREITVSAKRQPLHVTSTVASVNVSRKQLLRSTATVNDPVRALNTLPGVASESDLSAVPVVRGGDLQESRVFLDGISLLQPFHFGGMRSMFNTLAVEKLTLHKSGFPAEYHNAQSGLIVVESRSPARDSAVVSGDINLLQYCAYAALPFKKNTMGLSLSTQGSYFDFMTKRIMDVAAWGIEDTFTKQSIRDAKALVNQPDYQDYSAAFEWRPSDRFRMSVHELLASDKMWYTYGDSATTVTSYYSNKLYYFDEYGEFRCFDGPTGNPYIDARLRDTSFVHTDTEDRWSMGRFPLDVAPDSIVRGRPFYEIDTMMYYKSSYNLLYAKAQYLPAPDRIFNFSLAWQKRWWDLVFPEAVSDAIDTSRYDVYLDQCNAHAGMLYSGKNNHLIKCGLQWDLTLARYDVLTFRMLHEIIARGSTNYGDYWGPVTGDTGTAITDNGGMDGTIDMVGRLLVSYKGRRLYNNGSIYGEDEWTPTPRLTCTYGGRIEISESDTSVTFSPRASLKYQWKPDHELIAAAGLYTQNNYDVAALALCNDLKPEKVWHASVGMESRLLSWLTQKIDLYGKYYFDLVSEDIRLAEGVTPPMLIRADDYIRSQLHFNVDSLKNEDPDEYATIVMLYLIQHELYSSRYSNEGSGWAAGGEYSLRYDPADFWDGWISVTLGKSMRQRHPGWRWHDFPLERPLLVSLVNYYRLPRKFEIGLKYRYMSGIPYTPFSLGQNSGIGPYNSRRYGPYQSLDLKIARGFTAWGNKCHFYIEAWNMLNSPNMMLHDRRTREVKAIGMNMPLPMLFIGLDFNQ